MAAEKVVSSAELVRAAFSGGGAKGEAAEPAPEAGMDEDEARNVSAGEYDDQDGPSDEELYPSEETEDSQDSDESETSEESSKVAAADSKGKEDKGKTSGTKERVPINKGKSFIEIDYADKEATKKAHLMAHGARKWQAEKDELGRKFSSHMDEVYKPLKSNWDALETAFKGQGIEGVIDLLEGQKGAYQAHIKRQIQRNDFLKSASPEEKKALEREEQAERDRKAMEQEREENRKFRESVTQEREKSEQASMEAKVHPAFEKYRFKDRLGDENDEHMFDEMLWGTALKKLEPYEEKGLEITPAMIEGAFKSVAQSLRKRIVGYGEKAAARSVERKKEAATEQVQSKVMSGYRGNETSKEAMDLVRKGDLTSLLKGWGKYGSTFARK